MLAKLKKPFLFGITVCLVIMFFLIYMFSLRIGSKYSILVNDEIESKTLVQKITSESIYNYFILRNIISINDNDEVSKMKSVWTKHRDLNTSYIENLSSLTMIKKLSKNNLDYLVEARTEYLNNCNKYFAMIDSNDKKNATEFFNSVLEKSFFIYQNQINDFIFIHKSEVAAYNNSITLETKIFALGKSILGIPALIFVGIIYFALMLVFLVLLYRTLFIKENK